MNVMHVDRINRRFKTKFISLSVGYPPLTRRLPSTLRTHTDYGFFPALPFLAEASARILHPRPSVVKKTSLLKVSQKSCNRLIDLRYMLTVILFDRLMRIPGFLQMSSSGIELNKTHSRSTSRRATGQLRPNSSVGDFPTP